MRIFVATALLACTALPGLAQETARIDPALRSLLRAPATAVPAPLAGAPAIEAAPDGEPVVGVLVRLEGPAARAALEAAGARIGSVIGDIATARVPLSALSALAVAPGVRTVEAARVIPVTHDSSMHAIGVDEVRERNGDVWTGSTGQSVLVGVYDTGIDLLHEDFIDANGKTRVAAAWDQTQNQGHLPPPAPFSYGYICDRAAIQRRIDTGNAAECPLRDLQAHGTHVAGTATGDGSATKTGIGRYRFAGVAPAAELLVVKGGTGTFDEARMIDGLVWMKAMGATLGRPVVVNLSLGGQFGPRDGTRLSEQVIDLLAGPGFLIVFSAGNAGSNLNSTPQIGEQLAHARAPASGTQTATFEFEVSSYANAATLPCTFGISQTHVVQLEGWYESADRVRIEVVRPDGSSVIAPFGSLADGDAAQGHIAIDNAPFGANPENGDYEVRILISDCGASRARPAPGTWRVRATPEISGSGGPIDLWITGIRLPGGTVFGRQGFDNRFIVGTPGTATRAITVGAFVTKHCWSAQAGGVCFLEREETGDLAFFSGGGPRRDGVMKPDITAPGKTVASTLTSAVTFAPQWVTDDGAHVINYGTSMAAPHVTGVIALLLQDNPLLAPEQVRDILYSTARTDAFTSRTYGTAPGASPTDWWGAGKVDACAAVFSLKDSGPPSLLVDAAASPPAPSPVPGRRGMRLPLFGLSLQGSCAEPVLVRALPIAVDGDDPGAKLLLLRDPDGDGVAEEGAEVAGMSDVGGAGERLVRIEPDALTVAGEPTHFVVAIELSGAGPHGALFSAAFDPADIEAEGARTGLAAVLDGTTTPIAATSASTTLLAADQAVTLSENPVRSDRLHLNFAEPPAAAAVFTTDGRRVADLTRRLAGDRRSLAWDLTNDEGGAIVPGVYLLVIEVAGERVREKLMILPPAGGHPRP